MIGDIFYFIGFLLIFFIIFKIINFSKIVEITDWAIKFNKVTGKKPEIKDFRKSKDWKLIGTISVISIFESFWTLIGLLSPNNWPIFALLLISGILTNIINRSSFMLLKKTVTLLFFLIKFVFMVLLIINHFHLKIPNFGVGLIQNF